MTQSLRIVSRPDGAAPGKHQQRFNTLIKKVATLKRALQTWSDALPAIYRRVAECEQLSRGHHALLGDLVRLFDRMHDERTLTRRERTQLGQILCDLAGDLLSEGDDEALKAIYNKHSRSDFDAEAARDSAAQALMMKSILEDGFGLDFGGARISSLDDLEQAAKQQLEERERDAADRQAADDARKAKRKKSSRQVASEARREAETARIGKTLQEIYRKLVLLLHPDHEQDPEERARKTLLMQEVNVAYERRDLLQLLELRLRFEQVDEAHVRDIAEDRLVHFNTLLAEQVRQLQQELATVEEPWRHQLELPRSIKLTPARIEAALQDDLRELTADTALVRRDLTQLTDPRKLKAWLRTAHREAQQDVDLWPGR
jgi:hypothetical protein